MIGIDSYTPWLTRDTPVGAQHAAPLPMRQHPLIEHEQVHFCVGAKALVHISRDTPVGAQHAASHRHEIKEVEHEKPAKRLDWAWHMDPRPLKGSP